MTCLAGVKIKTFRSKDEIMQPENYMIVGTILLYSLLKIILADRFGDDFFNASIDKTNAEEKRKS